MARTIRTKVFKFNELSKDAKVKAIEWFKTILNEGGDILFGFEEYCQGVCAEAGFVNAEIRYSLSWSQGDGLSFSADIDKESFIKAAIPGIKKSVLRVLLDNTAVFITANKGHYAFAHPSMVEFCLEASGDYPNIETICDIVRKDIANDYMNVCKKLKKAGYEWIEDRYKDENVIADIEATEYEFTVDGRRF